MKYDALLKSGKIKKQQISKEEIERALSRAERDLKTARSVMAGDDVAGMISEAEAKNLFKMAVDFVALVKKLIAKK